MKELSIIKSEKQYIEYCNLLEDLSNKPSTIVNENRIELLELIIEKYTETQFAISAKDPISFLKDLLDTHGITQKQLADDFKVSKATMSLVFNYKRGLSKDIIRKLSKKFSIRQEVFNTPYRLSQTISKRRKSKVA